MVIWIHSIELAIDKSYTELDVGVITVVRSLSLELVCLGQQSLLGPLRVLVQNFGIIESNLSTDLDVVIDSLFLLFSLSGQQVAQLKIFISSNPRSGVNFTSGAKVDVWSLLLLLVSSR